MAVWGAVPNEDATPRKKIRKFKRKSPECKRKGIVKDVRRCVSVGNRQQVPTTVRAAVLLTRFVKNME